MIGSKVFIDTAPFIYMLEDNVQYSQRVRNVVSGYFAANVPLITSPLTFAEYCVVPYRQNALQKSWILKRSFSTQI